MDKTAPAFPQPHGEFGSTNGELHAEHGMTLRDYFAAKALSAFEVSTEDNMAFDFWYKPHDIAKRCYSIADAMLKERSKP